MKQCSRCKVKKQGKAFDRDKNSPDGLNSWCKVCKKEYALNKTDEGKKIKRNFKQESLTYKICIDCKQSKPLTEFSFRFDSKKHRPKCMACRANESQLGRYDVDKVWLEETKKKQGYQCAICGIHENEINHSDFRHNPLVIDHVHETGKVRGLLCSKCNAALGNFNDSISSLQNAIKYLKYYSKETEK